MSTTKSLSVSIARIISIVIPLILVAGCGSFSKSSDETSVKVTGSTQKFHCRNDIEIQCEGQSCVSSNAGEFTPMDVSFDDAGNLEVCAYSGCWEGRAEVVSNGQILVLAGSQFLFTSAGETDTEPENIALALDLTDKIATLKVDAYALPIICNLLPNE